MFLRVVKIILVKAKNEFLGKTECFATKYKNSRVAESQDFWDIRLNAESRVPELCLHLLTEMLTKPPQKTPSAKTVVTPILMVPQTGVRHTPNKLTSNAENTDLPSSFYGFMDQVQIFFKVLWHFLELCVGVVNLQVYVEFHCQLASSQIASMIGSAGRHPFFHPMFCQSNCQTVLHTN